MLTQLKATVLAARGIYRRKQELAKKLLRHPFFPLLFIAEFVKELTTVGVTTGDVLTPVVLAMGVLAVATTLMWMFAEHLLDEAGETYNEVAEALGSVQEG